MAEAAARLHDPIQHTRARSMLIVGAVVGGVVAGAFAIATAPVSIPVLLGTAGLGIATGAGMGELAGHFSFMKVVTGEIAIPGSPNVFINGRPAARAHLDMVDCRWHPAHPPVAQGSSNVFINGQPAARKGDRTACDAVILEGSPNVFIGGGTATTDNISPEVSDRMHKTVQLIGLGSAAVLFGPAVALVGWYASEPIGKAVHNLTGKAFGEGTNSQIAAELALSGLMIGVAGRGAARGGRAGPVNDVLATDRTAANLTERGTLTNLFQEDATLLQGRARTLVQDDVGRYWLQSGGKKITPSGSYDFVTLPDGTVRVARTNPSSEFSTHLGLSGGDEVSYAGTIRFANRNTATRGSIRSWSNDSGHYQPPSWLGGNSNLPPDLFLPR